MRPFIKKWSQIYPRRLAESSPSPEEEVWVISGASGVSNGFRNTSPRPQAVLDIFLSHDLQFPTMIGWANGHKDGHSANSAEKEFLIHYKRKDFKKIPEDLQETLNSLSEYRLGNPFPSNRRHDDIARELTECRIGPLSIIVFEELLDDTHRNDKRFVKITREKIISEIDEVVFRNFDRELNERMAEYLKDHKDPETEHLKVLMREYYPAARRILREQYKEIYPRSWRTKLSTSKITTPRIEVRRERLYAMPRPLCWWDGRNSYQQYFVMPSQKAICRGGGASSSQRETQSLFGLTFSLVDSQKRIPTHILVYDRHNMLLFVNTVKRLCLVPYDMGSNYDLPYNTVRKLLRNVLKATTSGEIGRIEAVSMTR